MVQHITSRENEKIKTLCKLATQNTFRMQTGLFVVEGIKLCRDIASVLPTKEIYCTEIALEKYPEISGFCTQQYIITDNVCEKISGVKTPQGVYGVFEMKQNPIKITANTRLLVLDGVQDPANVGAAFRSSVCFGFDGVILTENAADPYSPKALRSAMSSTVKIPFLKTDNLPATLQGLKEQGVCILAARLENSQLMDTVNPSGSLAIVIGNEGNGISEEVASICDCSVRIPISTEMESLNANVAAGILMWQYRK